MFVSKSCHNIASCLYITLKTKKSQQKLKKRP
nr:MAG TPA: hypothetical protein [Caudoviricetes sp.]